MKNLYKSNLLKLLPCALLGGVVLGTTSLAQAADGTISFNGELIAASCTVTGGAGATGSDGKVTVDMGKVSMDSLGTSGSVGVATQVNLKVDCASGSETLKTVKVRFDPQSGSGVDDSNPSLLKLSGEKAAKGVAIAIIDGDGKTLNLSGNDTISGELVVTEGAATADLNMRASYVKNGSSEPAAGTGSATLPFTLTYE
ncbi:hypothetical protein C4K35_4130 [Pseudomonas chlororaphis subsp. piscium]|uniref:fimbrial protein n=1 Tax=Pseudomonas chlororaphis TaxID=587753 RepID=UPI000F570E3C|nr:fimbrial protein [Pseudomonas chlororaphis]AZC51709.1 hypothetical protein C4K35_4130 [Pseudomonas chlororaphis subsp. piscium]